MGRSKSKKQANSQARALKPNKDKKVRFRCLNSEARHGQEFSITGDENKTERELAKIAAKRAWRTCKCIDVVQIQSIETGNTHQFRVTLF